MLQHRVPERKLVSPFGFALCRMPGAGVSRRLR